MLLLAVRHAESRANVDKSAGLDAELTALGHQQAAAIASRLQNAPLKAIYSSPFRRCIQTAQPIAELLGMPVRIRPDIAEFHHLPKGTTQQPHPIPSIDELLLAQSGLDRCADWKDEFTWPGLDESVDQLITRMQSFQSYIKSRWNSEEDIVLIISHGSPIARLIDTWLTNTRGPSFRFIIDNAALTALRFHSEIGSLICLNEASHLVGLAPPAAANYTANGLPKPIPPSAYW